MANREHKTRDEAYLKDLQAGLIRMTPDQAQGLHV
jgi:hypothetical protein